MLKALLKKQLLELSRSFFRNGKNGKNRSTGGIIALLSVSFVFLGILFFSMSFSLCGPLVEAGMRWLYFSITGSIAVFLGVFGSVFSTFSSLYQAKDNDLLLSLPIPVSYILIVRLLGVYLMGSLYTCLVMLPAVVVYGIVAARSVADVLCPLLLMILLTLFVLTLSCVLGWMVAKISARLKRKSLITVFISLVFIAAYYVVYFRANSLLQNIAENSAALGSSIKRSVYPLYMLGRAGEGDLASVLLCCLVILLLLFLTCYVLARSFLKLATDQQHGKKTVYKERAVKTKSLPGALLAKELLRFVSSANYMLNCALGAVMAVIGAVMVLIKGAAVREALLSVFGDKPEVLAVIGAGMLCLLSCMNDVTAPSISLEGKALWLSQALPVTPWQVLRAKIALHLLITLPPLLLCGLCIAAAIRIPVLLSVLMLLVAAAYSLLCAVIGLAVNLKKPDLNWTNEAVAVKQNTAIMLVIFGGWAFLAVLAILYLILSRFVPAALFLVFAAAVFSAVSWLLLRWLKTTGSRIFASL